jgi:hypothetical protein
MKLLRVFVASLVLLVASFVISFPQALADITVQENELISRTNAGDPANGDNNNQRMSADGRYVVYSSFATNLTHLPVPSGTSQTYFYNRQQQPFAELVSRTTEGQTADRGATPLAVSDNGRYVLMQSQSTNLPGYFDAVGGGANFLYLRDRHNEMLFRIGAPELLNVDTGPNSMSANGNIFVYRGMTSYTNNGNGNIVTTFSQYIYNRATNTTTLLPDGVRNMVVSANGQYVAYQLPQFDENNQYLFDRTYRYEIATGQSVEIMNDYPSSDLGVYLNADGSKAAFYYANLSTNKYELYVQDLTTGQYTQVITDSDAAMPGSLSLSGDNRFLSYSTRNTSENPQRRAWLADLQTGQQILINTSPSNFDHMRVSTDGTEVLFNSGSIITDGKKYVYIAKLSTDATPPPTPTNTPTPTPVPSPLTLDTLEFDYENNTLSGSGRCQKNLIYGEMYDAQGILYASGNLNTDTNVVCQNGMYSFSFSFSYWGISRDKDLGLPNRLVVYDTVSGTVQPGDESVEAFFTRVAPSQPVTVTFNAAADTHVRSGQGNHNYGGSNFMRLQSSGDNRALVRFDQGAIAASVGNGTILSAKLQVTIVDNGNNWGTTGRTVDVHRLINDWGEGNGTENDRGTGSGATWNCAIDSIISNQAENCSGVTEWEMGQPNNPSVHPWEQTSSATQTITNNQTGVVEYDVTNDVAFFMSGAFDNYGWIIKKTNEGQNGMVSFGTRESSSVPQLVVTYQP